MQVIALTVSNPPVLKYLKDILEMDRFSLVKNYLK